MDIPEYKIFIQPLNLSELRRDIWIDDPVTWEVND